MNRLARACTHVAVPAFALVAIAAGALLASPLVFIWGMSAQRMLFR